MNSAAHSATQDMDNNNYWSACCESTTNMQAARACSRYLLTSHFALGKMADHAMPRAVSGH